MTKRLLLPTLMTVMFATLSGCSQSDQAADEANAAAAAPAGVTTAVAALSESLPLATVPGTVTLPPEARVAVTAPFPGAAVRVFVIEGQAVRKGEPLALVHAAQTVQIQGELSRTQAELGLAAARAKRVEQLSKEGIVAQARAEEARAALRQAQASVAESRRLASLAGAGPDGMMTLRAPISGRVAHVGIETGGPVDGMAAPFVIENSSALRIDLMLPERLARVVTPGMAVEVRRGNASGDGAASSFAGRILSVAPSIDPATRSILAKASVPADPALVAGSNVTVVISGTSPAQGVAVPAAAIARIAGADHVFVRSGKSFVPRKVVVAALSGDRAVISTGLKPGDVVATSGIAELKSMMAE